MPKLPSDAPSRSLDKIWSNSAAPFLRELAARAGLKSVSLCGLTVIPGLAALLDRVSRGDEVRAVLHGVVTCNSPWSCPVCGPRLARQRVADLEPQIRALMDQGYDAWLVTLTHRHEMDDPLGQELDVAARAWTAVGKSRAFVKLRAGGLEFVRGLDLTHGRQGWHVHQHLVLLVPPGLASGDVALWLLDQWGVAVRSLGRVALARGQNAQRAVDPVAVAAYATAIAGVSKDAGSLVEVERPGSLRSIPEAVSAATKRGRASGGRTFRDLLDGALLGSRRDRALALEYMAATKGRRAVNVSRGLRLTPDAEAERQALVLERQAGEVREMVARLEPEALRRLDLHWAEINAAVELSVHEGRMKLRLYLGNPGEWWHLP